MPPVRPPLSEVERSGMRAALEEARAALKAGEVPVGAAVIVGDRIVATGRNRMVELQDLTMHAEMIAIREAMRACGSDRLEDATLCVTLEPCAQCAGAVGLARVGKVLFGAYDERAGMAGSVEDLLRHPSLNHRPEVKGGIDESECSVLLKEFFGPKR